MDTIGNTMRLEGFAANLTFNGVVATILPSGKTFNAIVSEASDLDPNMPLGSDIRELTKIDCARPIPTINGQDRIEINGTRLQVVRRVDNPANPWASFYAVKVAPNDK